MHLTCPFDYDWQQHLLQTITNKSIYVPGDKERMAGTWVAESGYHILYRVQQ